MTPDMDAIQGTWRGVSVANPSIGYADDDPGGFWEIRGNRIRVTNSEDETREFWFTFTLDITVTPKRIESVWERTKPNGEVLYAVIKGCYELSGDVLRIGGSGVLGEHANSFRISNNMIPLLRTPPSLQDGLLSEAN